MTSVARKQPTFGRRGNGPPQKSRIVASAPVTRLSTPLAKAPIKPASVREPSRVWTAPAALLKACKAASASALTQVRVAAAAAVQKGKSAVADFRAARALAKAQAAEIAEMKRVQAAEAAALRLKPASGPAQSLAAEAPAVAATATVHRPDPPAFDFVAELVAADPVPMAQAVALAETCKPGLTLQDLEPDVADVFTAPGALHLVHNVEAFELVAADSVPQSEAIAIAETCELEPAPQAFEPEVADIAPTPTALHLVSVVEASEIVVDARPDIERALNADVETSIDHAPAAFLLADAADVHADKAVFDQAIAIPRAEQAFDAELDANNDPVSADYAAETDVEGAGPLDRASAVQLSETEPAAEIFAAAATGKQFEPVVDAVSEPTGDVETLEVQRDAVSAAEAGGSSVDVPEAFEAPITVNTFETEPDAVSDRVAVENPAVPETLEPLEGEQAGAFSASIVAFPTKLEPPNDVTDDLDAQYELFAADGDAASVASVDRSDDWIWGRAYFLACAVAFPAAVALMCTFGGPADPLVGLGLVAQLFVAAISPLLGLVFFLPAVGLLQLAKLARIPRGLREVVTGGLLGTTWLLLDLNDGLTPPLAAYVMCAGGLLAGWIFRMANRPK